MCEFLRLRFTYKVIVHLRINLSSIELSMFVDYHSSYFTSMSDTNSLSCYAFVVIKWNSNVKNFEQSARWKTRFLESSPVWDVWQHDCTHCVKVEKIEKLLDISLKKSIVPRTNLSVDGINLLVRPTK